MTSEAKVRAPAGTTCMDEFDRFMDSLRTLLQERIIDFAEKLEAQRAERREPVAA